MKFNFLRIIVADNQIFILRVSLYLLKNGQSRLLRVDYKYGRVDLKFIREFFIIFL